MQTKRMHKLHLPKSEKKVVMLWPYFLPRWQLSEEQYAHASCTKAFNGELRSRLRDIGVLAEKPSHLLGRDVKEAEAARQLFLNAEGKNGIGLVLRISVTAATSVIMRHNEQLPLKDIYTEFEPFGPNQATDVVSLRRAYDKLVDGIKRIVASNMPVKNPLKRLPNDILDEIRKLLGSINDALDAYTRYLTPKDMPLAQVLAEKTAPKIEKLVAALDGLYVGKKLKRGMEPKPGYIISDEQAAKAGQEIEAYIHFQSSVCGPMFFLPACKSHVRRDQKTLPALDIEFPSRAVLSDDGLHGQKLSNRLVCSVNGRRDLVGQLAEWIRSIYLLNK